MKNPKYNYIEEEGGFVYRFDSIGNKGTISKVVQYTKLKEGVYNLAFGDYNQQYEYGIDDKVKTNNGDSKKVLITVVATLYDFTKKYPDMYIFATGSNDARTRLYRMGISNNLKELKQDFEVYGVGDGVTESFVIGKDYKGFLVKRK